MTIETPEDFKYEFDEQGELSVNKRISPIGTSWVQKPADGRAINSYNYGEQLITKIAVYQDLAKKEEPLSTFEQNFVKQLEANVTLAIEEGILK